MYKLIAIDMDGTLLKDDKTISRENKDAIKKATQNGIKIALSTGRPTEGIKKYLNELHLISENNYCVSFNGAVVENTKLHNIISQKPLSLDDLNFIYSLSKKIDVHVQLALKNSCITTSDNQYSRLDARLNNIKMYVKSFDDISCNDTIFKIMFMNDETALSRGIEKLPETIYEKYNVTRSESYILEFMNKDATKWYGVQMLAQKFGIDKSEIICIGDSGNDVHMIKNAGLGIAMGNAADKIKKISDYITKTNEENGVAYAIEKFILK